MNSNITDTYTEINLDTKPLVNLRNYKSSNYDGGRSNGLVMIWWFVQAISFSLSLHNFNNFRCWLLRLFGAKIGQGVVIRPTARFTYPWKISIGDYSWIGDDVVFYSIDRIEIGSHAVISQKSYLCTASHDFCDPSFPTTTSPIRIENGTWIATDCFVAPGVTIGANTVIGARSSVFRDIPQQQVAWGSPCIARHTRQMRQL